MPLTANADGANTISPPKSAWIGLLGLAALGWLGVAVSIVLLRILTNFIPNQVSPDAFHWIWFYISAIFATSAGGFAVATFVPWMGMGWLTIRFLQSTLLVTPMYGLMMFLMSQAMPGGTALDSDIYYRVGLPILSYSIGIAFVTLVTQWLHPIHLIRDPLGANSIRPMSIGHLMELMGLTALMISIWKFAAPRIVHLDECVLIGGVLGACCAASLLLLTAAVVGTGRRRWLGLGVSGFLTWVSASGLGIVFAWMNPNENLELLPTLFILGSGLFTATICVGWATLGMLWLRWCGWRCVEKVSPPSSPSPVSPAPLA